MRRAREEYGAQPQEYVIEWAKQLCDVLEYLHTRTPPIIYRDMKPENIMAQAQTANICLIDFGTAREFRKKIWRTPPASARWAMPRRSSSRHGPDGRADGHLLSGRDALPSGHGAQPRATPP